MNKVGQRQRGPEKDGVRVGEGVTGMQGITTEREGDRDGECETERRNLVCMNSAAGL